MNDTTPPALSNKLKGLLSSLALMLIGVLAIIYILSKSVFYAEPGYVYHVRTLTGDERVVSDVGYQLFFLGRWNSWKRALTVQAVRGGSEDLRYTETESNDASVSLPPLSVMFLDQVDAHSEATVRFSIPSDEEAFLKLAHEYRSPENLLRTALIPAFKETLQATGSLISAEDYYSGGRTEFNTEFERQMKDGIFIVRREEVRVSASRPKSTANATLGTNQQDYGEEDKTEFRVRKVLNADGSPVRKIQRFNEFGIHVVDARITNMQPNQRFVERMQLKQKASADRAIAREQRIQEEEQRLLAIARGEREVAERQAKAKVEQIQKTTEAETDKQLALTQAEKLRAQAQIEKETAEINLEKAKVEAETQRTLADAQAYEKRVILEADNALADKLKAEVEIQKLWADAFSKRAVPTHVFGAGDAGTPIGSDNETQAFMQILTLDAAKRLAYDRQIAPNTP